MNTGLYPILTLLARLDVTRLSDSRKYVGMHLFHPLLHRCTRAKIWKVRAMAARCLPVVLDPDRLSKDIAEMFANFRLDAQNELHGGLMGVKSLAEFYSYRELKHVVFGTVFLILRLMVYAIVFGMEGSLELVLRENGNPLTKAAFVEIAHFLLKYENKATALVERALILCLEDLQAGMNESVGWQLYLEQVASLVLDVREKNIDCESVPYDVLNMLLQNDNEEVVLKTLTWLSNTKSAESSTPILRQSLGRLIRQDKFDRVCALALRAIPKITCDNEQEFGVGDCVRGYKASQVMPVREGWIVLAGFTAHTVFSYLFDAEDRNA